MPVAETAVSSPLFLAKCNNLCSNTDQVRGSNYNVLKVKELCKFSIVDNLIALGFEDIAYKVNECGTTFVHLRDKNGHEKYTKMYCKNDFCPTCGQVNSAAHKRRTVRALDRLIWADILGYMVFTLPKEVSAMRPGKETFNYLSKKAWEIVKDNFETPGAMTRIHLMGEEPETLHIHINILFPVLSELGKVPQETLDNIRTAWTRVVNNFFELKCEVTNVFYKFALLSGKRVHQVNYVLRPVVTPDKFLTLPEECQQYVLSLKGWHSTRWYGKLANGQYKKYLQSKGINPAAYENQDISVTKKCPICGEQYKFVEIIHQDELPKGQVRMIDKGIWVDLETAAYLIQERSGDG